MATIKEVRSELQIDAGVLSDADVQYAIDKITNGDLNLVCAQVLRMVLGKYRGRVKLKIGKFEEVVDPTSLKALISFYTANSTTGGVDDGYDFEDAYFTRDNP